MGWCDEKLRESEARKWNNLSALDNLFKKDGDAAIRYLAEEVAEQSFKELIGVYRGAEVSDFFHSFMGKVLKQRYGSMVRSTIGKIIKGNIDYYVEDALNKIHLAVLNPKIEIDTMPEGYFRYIARFSALYFLREGVVKVGGSPVEIVSTDDLLPSGETRQEVIFSDGTDNDPLENLIELSLRNLRVRIVQETISNISCRYEVIRKVLVSGKEEITFDGECEKCNGCLKATALGAVEKKRAECREECAAVSAAMDQKGYEMNGCEIVNKLKACYCKKRKTDPAYADRCQVCKEITDNQKKYYYPPDWVLDEMRETIILILDREGIRRDEILY